jgi:CubicO group peptidase (beta-lactamase class C family)
MKQDKVIELENKINNDYKNIAGITVLKDGKIEYENYFNGCNSESTIHVYSVTKSIVSILIGIAVDNGYIESIDQKIRFIPEPR